MVTPALLLVTLPAATFAASAYASRPTEPQVAAKRLAAVRASVLVGAYAVVSVELLSVVDHDATSRRAVDGDPPVPLDRRVRGFLVAAVRPPLRQ